jgi:hypothetical protein
VSFNMSSTSPQPLPQIPPIESLAPPLPDASTVVAAPSSESKLETKPETKNEPWVPVEVHGDGGAENASRTSTSPDSSTTSTATVKVATAVDQSSTLFNRVMKQRSTVLPQTAHIQKDNTLAIFVTLCLVVVAIACGIYFVADRETQNQGADHATSALVQNEATSTIAPPSSLFGKPAEKTQKKNPADQLIQQSQTQLSSMQYIEAEYSAQQATKLAPASGDAWLALGRALYSEGRYSGAERAFKTCMKLDAHSKAASTAADFMSQMPALGQTK